MEFKALVASVFPKFFLFFRKLLGIRFCGESEFSNEFLHYLNFYAFSLPRKIAFPWSGKIYWSMCTVVSFDASVDCERTFLMEFLPKVVRKEVSLTFSDLSKTFYPIAQRIKVNWASGSRLGCKKRNSRETFMVCSVVGTWSGQDTLWM